jgi:hypothetical protein
MGFLTTYSICLNKISEFKLLTWCNFNAFQTFSNFNESQIIYLQNDWTDRFFFNCDIVRHWQLLMLFRSDVSVCKEKDENNKIERLCRVTVIKSLTKFATTDAGSWIHVHVKKSCWFIFSLTIWILCLPCHDKHWQRTKHIVWATINRCSTYDASVDEILMLPTDSSKFYISGHLFDVESP